MNGLKDKIAIVTGAGKGIGRGIAHRLAKEGAKVTVSDILINDAKQVAEELSREGAEVIAIECDVSQKEAVDNLINKTVEKFGQVDILVNNAGIYPFKAFVEMIESDWDKVINTNLKSIFLCSQAAAKNMRNGGKIINISSIAAFVGFEGLVHYCASKGGVNGLTRALALELAKQKICVNAVAPGAINTPGASGGSEETKKQTLAMIPLDRMGEPEDIAATVVFLASNDADYITGQTIIVDGGWTLR